MDEHGIVHALETSGEDPILYVIVRVVDRKSTAHVAYSPDVTHDVWFLAEGKVVGPWPNDMVECDETLALLGREDSLDG